MIREASISINIKFDILSRLYWTAVYSVYWFFAFLLRTYVLFQNRSSSLWIMTKKETLLSLVLYTILLGLRLINMYSTNPQNIIPIIIIYTRQMLKNSAIAMKFKKIFLMFSKPSVVIMAVFISKKTFSFCFIFYCRI